MSTNAPRTGRALSFFSAATLAWMVLVILEGAVVRATSSGAGCGNHWPLCNGDFVPHHPRLATIIEYTHRSMTGICTMLTFGMIAWVYRVFASGSEQRRAAAWSGILLITEGALGAVLVKGGYVESNASNMRVFVQCIHFTNTMLLVAALTLTWWRVHKAAYGDVNTSLEAPASARPIAWLALIATMATGATGSVAALADTLFPAPSLRAGFAADFDPNSPLLIHMRWMHPVAAILSVACVAFFAARFRHTASRWLMALAALQIAFGVVDILLLAPITMQVLHLLGADLYWIAMVIACSEALRSTSSASRAQVVSTGPLTAS
ncbi:heme A synthase [Granulicella cerasi]|uniref:Heme A synthase n=1 Tax=Granulicella cerasi TaxID=741063 RepID=A0ABW1ZDF9_9BACT|nr:COX15/CtaA family protein [Granulicella cerasi]